MDIQQEDSQLTQRLFPLVVSVSSDYNEVQRGGAQPSGHATGRSIVWVRPPLDSFLAPKETMVGRFRAKRAICRRETRFNRALSWKLAGVVPDT